MFELAKDWSKWKNCVSWHLKLGPGMMPNDNDTMWELTLDHMTYQYL